MSQGNLPTRWEAERDKSMHVNDDTSSKVPRALGRYQRKPEKDRVRASEKEKDVGKTPAPNTLLLN